jgi:hypothetical protein
MARRGAESTQERLREISGGVGRGRRGRRGLTQTAQYAVLVRAPTDHSLVFLPLFFFARVTRLSQPKIKQSNNQSHSFVTTKIKQYEQPKIKHQEPNIYRDKTTIDSIIYCGCFSYMGLYYLVNPISGSVLAACAASYAALIFGSRARISYKLFSAAFSNRLSSRENFNRVRA